MASWQVWALLSAVFAALTAIFAKIGVADINPDAATLIRTAVILVALTLVVAGTRELPSLVGAPARTYRVGPYTVLVWDKNLLTGRG